MTSVSHSWLLRSIVNAWELLIWVTVTGECSNRNHGYFLWSIFAIHFFCFVLCIHLVPSYNSLMIFVSNFSVYFIIVLMYLFTFLFIHLLIQSIKTWISLLVCLFIIYLWIYTASKNPDFVIYLSTYLFVCLFIYMNCPISVHTQFVYFFY